MNHSRRRRRTWHPGSSLVAALAFLAACGSNGGSSSEVGAAGARTNARAPQEVAHGSSAPQAAGGGAVTVVGEQDEADDQPVGPPVASLFLCQHDPVAFDLSKLYPAGSPMNFRLAWEMVQGRAEIPGIVVAYSGLRSGPSINMQVGAVSHASAGELGFQRSLPPSRAVAMGLSANDPFRLRSPDVAGVFTTSFGKRRQREGFSVTSVMVDGRLDAGCQYLSDVTAELVLPVAGNADRPFGNSNLDQELGPPTRDTDRDGKPDSWVLTLTGPSLEAMDFKL